MIERLRNKVSLKTIYKNLRIEFLIQMTSKFQPICNWAKPVWVIGRLSILLDRKSKSLVFAWLEVLPLELCNFLQHIQQSRSNVWFTWYSRNRFRCESSTPSICIGEFITTKPPSFFYQANCFCNWFQTHWVWGLRIWGLWL